MKKEKKQPSQTTSKIRYSFVKILTGSDLSKRRLPFMAADSGKPGPVVWLTACGHGDEVGGIVIIQDIFKSLRKIPLARGALYAFPLMNPLGFEAISRNVTFSEEDLNRSFPGNANGSLGERIAEKIFTSIRQTKPTIVLDLHNDWRKSIPYTLIDPDPGTNHAKTYEKTIELSKKTGFLLIRDTELVKQSLTYSLLQHDIPALTLELGESFIVSEKNIEYGVQSVWNLLSHLEMIAPLPELFHYPIPEKLMANILNYSHQPLSSTSGIIRFLVKPGDIIQKGQPICKIYNTFGKQQETINALHNGIIIGSSDSSVAFPGVPIVAFGITS